MSPDSDFDKLPTPEVPNKIVVHANTTLIGKFVYIAINTVPQFSYLISCFAWYMSKASPAHLAYAKTVLTCLIGVNAR